jgi:hypothetical protein
LAPSARAVGLCDYRDDLKVWLDEEVFQRGDRELWCAAEEEAQGVGPGWSVR